MLYRVLGLSHLSTFVLQCYSALCHFPSPFLPQNPISVEIMSVPRQSKKIKQTKQTKKKQTRKILAKEIKEITMQYPQLNQRGLDVDY